MSMSTSIQKTVSEICRKPRSHWVGDGFHVFPVFANKAFTKELSPFLMFDYAAPEHFGPDITKGNDRRGVGQHPHRGFETVTLAFQGEVEHRDSTGNHGIIGPGDCQWMTAARGIVHEEFHSDNFTKKGGTFEMCQLWVNLPKKDKMTNPRYQEILNKDIPKVPLRTVCDSDGTCSEAPIEDGYARIIAGNFQGKHGPAKTFSAVNLWDIGLLAQDKEFELDFLEGHTTLIFVRRGAVTVQGKSLGLADVAIMSLEGTKVQVQANEENSSILILSGEPIDEPIAARGPFVMNEPSELRQAMMDYHSGSNGFTNF